MQAHPDIETWTTEDVIGWMGLDKLDLDTAEQTTIAAELIQSALAVPEGLKGTVIQNIRSQMPTLEEVLSQQGPISNERYAELAAEWEAAGASWGTALNSGASQSLMAGAKSHRSSLQSALSAATASPFTISPSVSARRYFTRIAVRYWWCAAIPVATFLALGTADWRWLVVALAVIFILAPTDSNVCLVCNRFPPGVR